MQVMQTQLQVLAVRFLREAIHPYGRILAHATVGLRQSWYIDEMRQ